MEYRIKYSDAYLEHHGIKGQKWGIRRFQNPDGTLTPAGQKRYNYRESDSYKNADKKGRAKQRYQYNRNRLLFGEKAANKMQYKINEQGADNNKLQQKEIVKQVAKYTAVMAGLSIATVMLPDAIEAGTTWYEMQKNHVALNNAVIDLYAQMANIPYDNKVGVGLGLDAAARGKQMYDILSPSRKR